MQPSTMRGTSRLRAAAIILVTMMACSKGEKPAGRESAKASAADSGTTRGGAAMAVASGAKSKGNSEPGALPKPVDQMTGDELFDFTRRLSFGGGHERARRCRGRQGCNGAHPRDSTLVRVDAVETEDSLSVGDLAANGVIGARALNKGSLEDSTYHTRPGRQYEYYLIVRSAGAGAAKWVLEELTTTAGSRSHRTVAQGAFHECNHPYQRGARADFKTCAQAAAVRPASFGAMFQGEEDSPIWIGCAAGCCTSDPGDGVG